jgi:hypothetical protein
MIKWEALIFQQGLRLLFGWPRKTNAMKKVGLQRRNLLQRPEGLVPKVLKGIKSRTQIVLGLIVAALVVITSAQTSDFNLIKEKMVVLKALTRWFGMILFK